MVAQLDDQPSRLLVDTAIAALSRMTHRGGVAADGLTGDGCGLLLRRPDAFLKLLASEAGIAVAARFAAGLVFLPHDADAAQACRAQLQAQVEAVGCKVAGWREVPTDDSVCGQLARDTLPRIEQVFVDAGVGQDDAGFALALFLARRRSEQQLREHADFYVATLTPDAISYKGMVLPDKLSRFFPDLQRRELASSAIVFHQRFDQHAAALAARPPVPHARPQRRDQHHRGQSSLAQARSKVWKTPRFDIGEFDPVISMHGSDSQSLTTCWS